MENLHITVVDGNQQAQTFAAPGFSIGRFAEIHHILACYHAEKENTRKFVREDVTWRFNN